MNMHYSQPLRTPACHALLVFICLSTSTVFASDNGPLPAHPSFYGVWQIKNPSAQLRTDQGRRPPLLPEAEEAYEKSISAKRRGDLSWDPVQQCQMHGVPRIMYENMPFQILETQQQVIFAFQWNREFRIVDLNVPHQEPPGPLYLGQSIGRWEGETLVIDSNAFDPSTHLDASGLPHSDALHVIERYRVSRDGRTLTGEFTIEDPKTFSRPWKTVAHFRRLVGTGIKEDVCVDRLNLKQYQ